MIFIVSALTWLIAWTIFAIIALSFIPFIIGIVGAVVILALMEFHYISIVFRTNLLIHNKGDR